MMAQPVFAPFEAPLSVPLALSSRKNWIGWRLVPDPDDPDNPKKMPVVLVSGVPVNDYLKPHAHVTYDEALAQVEPLRLAGLGFVMTLNCGMIGGDMDGCRDPVSGVIELWAKRIIDRKETYFEISPSGRGVRFFSLTDVPLRETILSKPAGVELYSKLRYLTFTGNRILGTPLEVQRASYAVETLMARVADAKAAARASKAPTGSSKGQPDPAGVEAFKRKVYDESPMGKINKAAMNDFDAWVPELFPGARKDGTGKGYRVSSVELGRPLQEDLALHPEGIKDFGVHDLGDPREGGRSPIDVVMEWSNPPLTDPKDAAEWLGVRVGLPFDSSAQSGGASIEDLKAVDDWNAALARLRKASPRPAFVNGGSPGGVFDPSYSGPVPLRPGVTDRLTRGFVASVSSAANAGKSTYLGSEAVAVACERADLLGLASIDWCGDVMIVSNEESETTLACRWRGVMKEHGLQASDLKHKIRFWPTDLARLRIGRGSKTKTVTPTLDGVRFVTSLAELAEAGSPVAVLGIDTLVSIFEGVDESGAEMDKAMGLLIAVAEAGFIAIDVMQHQGKAADDRKETIHGYRGSSAIFAALGEMSTLVTLSAQEGRDFGLDARDSLRTVRLMGQRQRDGIVPGTYYLQREIVALPAEDPRAPGVLASRTVAVLKPVALGIVSAAGDMDEAWRALWDEQRAGRSLRLGASGRGRRHVDWAVAVVEESLGWSPVRAGRAVDELGRSGGWTLRKGRDKNKNPVDFIDVAEPPKAPESPF